MIKQSCLSSHLALETRKSKSQLLKPHISLKILFEWTNIFRKHFKLIFNHLKLSKQVSNDKTKLFKWSFDLRNKEIKKSTLETSYFLENAT